MFFLNSYILLLFLVLPLYAPFGYTELGDAKVRLYVVAALVLGVLASGQAMWRWLRIAFFSRCKRKKTRSELLSNSEKNAHCLSEPDSEEKARCLMEQCKENEVRCLPEQRRQNQIRVWRAALLLLLLSMIVSSLQPADFGAAWRGSDGWLMGLLVQGLAVLFAFFLSFPQTAEKEQKLVSYLKFCLYTGGGIVILLGILNRFRIYPFEYMRVDSSFLSTLGNIDWFCGYLAVVVPYAMGDLYLSRVKNPRYVQMKSPKHRLRISDLLVGGKMAVVAASFLLLILLGAESAYLILVAGFLILFLAGVGSRQGRMAFLEQLISFCLIPAILHGFIMSCPQLLDSYLWEDETRISVLLIHSGYRILLVAAVLAFGAWIYEFRRLRQKAAKLGREEKTEEGGTTERTEEAEAEEAGAKETESAERKGKETYGKRQWFLMCLAGFIVVALLLMLLALQLFCPDFFSGRFGSSRGMIWQVCSRMFLNFDFLQKLFGVGPDCLYPYLLAHPEYREVLLARFGVDLMNAHSVLLQRLLTTGIVGTVLYLLVMVMSFRIFCFHRGALPYIMMLSAYLMTGAVLFEQITNFPLMLALLGVGVREADRSAIL